MMTLSNIQAAARRIPMLIMSMITVPFSLPALPPNLFEDIPPCAFGRSLDWAGTSNCEILTHHGCDGEMPPTLEGASQTWKS
jgi:hypothetical protein